MKFSPWGNPLQCAMMHPLIFMEQQKSVSLYQTIVIRKCANYRQGKQADTEPVSTHHSIKKCSEQRALSIFSTSVQKTLYLKSFRARYSSFTVFYTSNRLHKTWRKMGKAPSIILRALLEERRNVYNSHWTILLEVWRLLWRMWFQFICNMFWIEFWRHIITAKCARHPSPVGDLWH